MGFAVKLDLVLIVFHHRRQSAFPPNALRLATAKESRARVPGCMRVCTLAELVVVKFVSSTSIALDLVKLRAVLSQRVLEVQSAPERELRNQ